jgi:hypothetical protein
VCVDVSGIRHHDTPAHTYSHMNTNSGDMITTGTLDPVRDLTRLSTLYLYSNSIGGATFIAVFWLLNDEFVVSER